MDNEIELYWKKKEEENSSKLITSSFSYFYTNGSKTSGLLYLMENGVYFENFESKNWFFQIMNKKAKFVEIKIKFLFEEIKSCIDPNKIEKKSFFSVILDFFKPKEYIIELETNSGKYLFELLNNNKSFLKIINEKITKK